MHFTPFVSLSLHTPQHVVVFTLRTDFSATYHPTVIQFCLFQMEIEYGVSEDSSTVLRGTFLELKSYFDQKFSHLKRELSDDQARSSSSLAKKLSLKQT